MFTVPSHGWFMELFYHHPVSNRAGKIMEPETMVIPMKHRAFLQNFLEPIQWQKDEWYYFMIFGKWHWILPHPRMVCDALENSCLHCSFFPIARTFLVGSRLLLAMLSFLFFVDWIAISIRSTPCALSWPANRVTYLVLSDIGSCCRPWPSLDTMQDS